MKNLNETDPHLEGVLRALQDYVHQAVRDELGGGRRHTVAMRHDDM